MANPLICVFNPISTLIDQVQSLSTGPGVAGAPVVLNALGLIDSSLIGTGLATTAGETLSGGRLVNLYTHSGALFVQNAWAGTTGTSPSGISYPIPANGFVTQNTSISNTALVQFSGLFTYIDPNAEFSAGDIGAQVYLSATSPEGTNGGGITKTQPSGIGEIQQTIGTVVNFTAPNSVLVSFGVSGGIAGSGTTGFVPVFSGSTVLGNSSLEEEGYLQTAEGFLSTSLTVNPFGNVGATVTATPTGSGPTTYRYVIAVLDTNNYTTAGSAPSSPITNATTLDGSHFNTITWSPNPVFAGAALYNIFRTVGGATQGIIGQWFVGDPPFVDNGLVGDGSSVPTQNFSGSIVAQNTLAIIGWTSAAFSPDVSNTICVGETPGGGVIPQPGAFNGAIKLTTLKFADGTQQTTGLSYTLFVGGVQIPVTGVKFPNASAINLSSGNHDLYTCPANKMALVIDVVSTVPAGNPTAVTGLGQVKISATYWPFDFFALGQAAGHYGENRSLAPFLLRTGEIFAVNTDNSGMSVWPFIVEFDSTANITDVRILGLVNGAQTLFTMPGGKSIAFMGFPSALQLPNAGRVWYYNGSTGSRNIEVNAVPNAGSVSTNNAIFNASTSNGQMAQVLMYGSLASGDFISITTDSSASGQVAWIIYTTP